MRYPLLLLVLGLATGCAVRYPAVVAMREQQFRSHDEAVGLPLDLAGRGEGASFLGMIPMALGLEAGSEQYAPLARAIIGGLALSVVVTMFLVPAVYLVIHGRDEARTAVAEESI